MQNYAARVILRITKLANINTHLKSLHWLPVNVGSTCKIACLSYHCHNSAAPSYVIDMLQKRHHTPALAQTHTPCFFSLSLHSIRQHLAIAHFILHVLPGLPFHTVRYPPLLSSSKSRSNACLLRSVYKVLTFSFDHYSCQHKFL